jgi:hypothetical protein
MVIGGRAADLHNRSALDVSWGGVIHERRKKHGFLLSAWAFLPNHWHAIFSQRFVGRSRVLARRPAHAHLKAYRRVIFLGEK